MVEFSIGGDASPPSVGGGALRFLTAFLGAFADCSLLTASMPLTRVAAKKSPLGRLSSASAYKPLNFL